MLISEFLKKLDTQIACNSSYYTVFSDINSDKVEFNSIAIDSRVVKKGSMFFCIKGLTNNAHKYIVDVIGKGAVAIVHSDELEKEQIIDGIVYIKVADTLETLNYATNIFFDYPSSKLNVYAVTGTNGKTTTAYLIQNILSNFEKSAYLGTIGHKIGETLYSTEHVTTPDNLALNQFLSDLVDADVKSVALEISSHALELKRADNLDVDIAIYTNLTHDHLDFHGNITNYKNAKLKLFKALGEDKKAILNYDDAFYNDFRSACKCKVLTYGISKNCDYRFSDISLYANKTEFTLHHQNSIYRIKTNLLGMVNIYNLSAALASINQMGYKITDIIKHLGNINFEIGRLQYVPSNRRNVIVDYAHSPDSFEKIFEFAKSVTTSDNRVIAVFGSAGGRDKLKRPIMGELADKFCDVIVLTTDDPRFEDPEDICREISNAIIDKSKVHVIVDRYKAIEYAIKNSNRDDTVLLLSKGMEREIPINGVDVPWAGDAVVALEVLSKL